MSALGPGEIRARRRPFVVLGVSAVRLLCGFCLALPLSSLVAESGVGLRTEGDRALFESGGYLLLELARLHGAAFFAVVRGLLPVLALGLVLTAACNAVLLVALNEREKLRARPWLSEALSRLPAMCLVGGLCVFGQGLLLLFGAIAADGVPDLLTRPVLTTALQAGAWLLALLAASALGGFADVLKAALVRNEAPLTVGVARAWDCARQRPFFAGFGWMPYAAVFIVSVVVVAELVELVDVSRPGGWRLGLVLLLHQSVVLLSVAVRASWFAKALRVVATSAA